jgi:hypothetical protein
MHDASRVNLSSSPFICNVTRTLSVSINCRNSNDSREFAINQLPGEETRKITADSRRIRLIFFARVLVPRIASQNRYVSAIFL